MVLPGTFAEESETPAPATGEMIMKKILMATDGSEISDRALGVACEFARLFTAEIVLVNVEQGFPPNDVEPFNISQTVTIDEVLYAASKKLLALAQQKANALGIADVRTHSGLGDPAGYILEFAREEKPDLIVVGRRGRGQLAGLLLGSVSQKLVSFAPCSVLVVP
jgi:nucleotide-binding universal stress UspA family protein